MNASIARPLEEIVQVTGFRGAYLLIRGMAEHEYFALIQQKACLPNGDQLGIIRLEAIHAQDENRSSNTGIDNDIFGRIRITLEDHSDQTYQEGQ